MFQGLLSLVVQLFPESVNADLPVVLRPQRNNAGQARRTMLPKRYRASDVSTTPNSAWQCNALRANVRNVDLQRTFKS